MLLAVAVAVPLRAADSPAGDTGNSGSSARDEPLVISKGTFVRKGQNVPATLRNLVDQIRERYRYANITLVGVDDVTIDNLTLQ